MKRTIVYSCFATLILASFFCTAFAQPKVSLKDTRTLLVFFDGLRPDYITAENMPNLYAFSKKAAYGNAHHSVFPTVTRVNASAYATGSYPAKSGILGNTVYFPQVDPVKGLNTGEASELNRISAATGGKLLTAVSLGELLAKAGHKMMVFSSGSSGQALLQNHTVSGGAVINTSLILPESLKPKLEAELGAIPPTAKPNSAQHKWITDALIKYALNLDAGSPLVSAIWFSDPDAAAHEDGIGVPVTMASIRSVDEQFGRILAALEAKGLTGNFNIIISADHGFISHSGANTNEPGTLELLLRNGLKKTRESDDVVLAEGAIYVKDHDPVIIRKIVTLLQSKASPVSIFTRSLTPGDTRGMIEGTFSFSAIHWDHPERQADILLSSDWNDDKNAMGYPGMNPGRGVAGHGGFSSYEVHIALLASGPAFKKEFKSDYPSSNVDIVPTVLHILGLPVPASMDGRVLQELLVERPQQPLLKVSHDVLDVSTPVSGGTYRLKLSRTLYGKYIYLDYAKPLFIKENR